MRSTLENDMFVFEPVTMDGELAEERFHEQEWDKEEYDRIFKFVSPFKMLKGKTTALELENDR